MLRAHSTRTLVRVLLRFDYTLYSLPCQLKKGYICSIILRKKNPARFYAGGVISCAHRLRHFPPWPSRRYQKSFNSPVHTDCIGDFLDTDSGTMTVSILMCAQVASDNTVYGVWAPKFQFSCAHRYSAKVSVRTVFCWQLKVIYYCCIGSNLLVKLWGLMLRARSIRTSVRMSIISDHFPKVKFCAKKEPRRALNFLWDRAF